MSIDWVSFWIGTVCTMVVVGIIIDIANWER